jgi:hypothetical protein
MRPVPREAAASATPAPPAPAAVEADAPADAAAAAAPDASDGGAGVCPEDMVVVEGELCPIVVQICTEHHPEYLKNKHKSERCLRYREPTHCLSENRPSMHFCIDRYEWPNKRGERPQVLVQWLEAEQMCASVGKRLCDEAEWLFACEGEEGLPHVYGYVRDEKKCLIDKPYVNRTLRLKRWGPCMQDPKCKHEFEKLDQRAPSGSFPECVSPFGAYDMNGSVNEWVNVPDRPLLHRSGLKGGWWGPVRNRCRPTVLFHKEDDWGYEAGFRCCKDALRPDGSVDDRRADGGVRMLREEGKREEEAKEETGSPPVESHGEAPAAPVEKAPAE